MTAGEKSIRPPPGSRAGEQVRLPLRSPFSMGVVACVGFEWPARCWRSRWPGALVLAACGGDDDDDASSSGSETSTTVAPEDLRASDADVAAGLAEIKATSAQIATTVEADAEQAGKLNDTIEPAWQPIEGTIKANDPDAYITFEDNFAALGDAVDSGDADSGATGSRHDRDGRRRVRGAVPGVIRGVRRCRARRARGRCWCSACGRRRRPPRRPRGHAEPVGVA